MIDCSKTKNYFAEKTVTALNVGISLFLLRTVKVNEKELDAGRG